MDVSTDFYVIYIYTHTHTHTHTHKARHGTQGKARKGVTYLKKLRTFIIVHKTKYHLVQDIKEKT